MQHYTTLLKNGFTPEYRKVRKGKKTLFECSNIFTFDIETTSYWLIAGKITAYKPVYTDKQYNDAEKGSLCYIWQFSIEDKVYYGRFIEDFPKLLDYINSILDKDCLRYIYVHNLAFEMQTLRNVIEIESVFARTARKPMYFTANKFEFRCSYMLTMLSLETWGKKIGINKKVGQLDYNVLRTPLTPLTEKELEYCELDCLVVYEGIKKFVEKYKSITNIPLTQTGEVRRVVKKLLRKDYAHHRQMSSMLPKSYDFYKILKWAFAGGSTGTTYMNSDKLLKDVWSFDKTSDYPYQLFQKEYPVTSFKDITGTKESYKLDNDKNCYIYICKFTNLKHKKSLSYLSTSRCRTIKNVVVDNGKIVSCDMCITCLTNADMEIMEMVYDFEIEIIRLYRARKGYMNKTFLEYILELYQNKTNLKGLTSQAEKDLYMQSKQYINSASFGMLVMDMLQKEVIFKNNDWQTVCVGEEKFYETITDLKENIYKNVFAYSQGVYITALARLELWKALVYVDNNSISECDVVYYDTDSCKIINGHTHYKYFENENKKMIERLKKVSDELEINFELFNPKNQKGNVCTLGLWENEDERKNSNSSCYKEFKTLGAKRYAYKLYDNTIHITISGVPKSCACVLKDLNDFKNGFLFDKDITDEKGNFISKKMVQYLDGCNLHTVFDDGYVCDYDYGCVIRNTTYKLDLTSEYLALIQCGKEKGRI